MKAKVSFEFEAPARLLFVPTVTEVFVRAVFVVAAIEAGVVANFKQGLELVQLPVTISYAYTL